MKSEKGKKIRETYRVAVTRECVCSRSFHEAADFSVRARCSGIENEALELGIIAGGQADIHCRLAIGILLDRAGGQFIWRLTGLWLGALMFGLK